MNGDGKCWECGAPLVFYGVPQNKMIKMAGAFNAQDFCRKTFGNLHPKFVASISKYVRSTSIGKGADFWDAWRDNKDALKKVGVQLTQYKGIWQANLWTKEETPAWIVYTVQIGTPAQPTPSPILPASTTLNRITTFASLPAGIYFKNQTVYKVTKTKYGRTWAKQLHVFPAKNGAATVAKFKYAPNAIRKGIITAADRMTLQQARDFGATFGVCANCGRLLTNAKSVDIGMGPVCRKHFMSDVEANIIAKQHLAKGAQGMYTDPIIKNVPQNLTVTVTTFNKSVLQPQNVSQVSTSQVTPDIIENNEEDNEKEESLEESLIEEVDDNEIKNEEVKKVGGEVEEEDKNTDFMGMLGLKQNKNTDKKDGEGNK